MENPSPTSQVRNLIHLVVISSEDGIDVLHELRRNCCNLAKTNQKNTLEHAGRDRMIGEPFSCSASYMILGASNLSVLMEIESPMEVVFLWWIVAHENHNVETVELEVFQ